MRSLSPDDAELWAKVAATIRRYSGDQRVHQSIELKSKAHRVTAPIRRTQNHDSNPPVKRSEISQQTLDGSWDKKLRGGSVVPDRLLDLHGMNLDTAWRAIDRTVEQAITRGDRVILLITGHHRSTEHSSQRGRIRAAIHDWLASSRHADDIAAVRPAHRRHGGGGSLYLVLRRRPSSR